jgi:YbbR domain-containing protein
MNRFFVKIREIVVTRSLLPKLVSILLAVILWAYIGSTKIGEVSFRVPVEYKNLPGSLVVAKTQFNYLSVVFRGKKEEIKNINMKNIRVFVNLESARLGDNLRFPVEITKQDIPDGINFSVPMKNVTLTIERKVSRRVRVIPVITGDSAGTAVGNIRVQPEFITVTGAESAVKNISAIQTEKIPVNRETGKVIKEVQVDMDELKSVILDAKSVSVFIPIFDSANLVKIERGIDIKNANSSFKYLLSDKTVKVYVKASPDAQTLSERDIEASIDVSALNMEKAFRGMADYIIEKDFKVNVSIKAPKDGHSVIMVVPDKVYVRIVKK